MTLGFLFEGKVIYDLTNGHVSYGCGTCCSTSSVYLTYDPFPVGLGATATNGVWTRDDCGDTPDNDSGSFYDWTTASAAIATTTKVGLHTGVAMGSTTSSTYGEVIHSNGRSGCYLLPIYPGGPTNVVPSVTISGLSFVALAPREDASPSSISLTANPNPGNGTYQWTASNANVSLSDTTSIVVSVAVVNASATKNDTLNLAYTLNAYGRLRWPCCAGIGR